MNFVIDIGNTIAKLAVFQQDELLHRELVPPDELEKKIEKVFSEYPNINAAIVSNVSKKEFWLTSKLEKEIPVLHLDTTTKLPFNNLYATPATLGNDRKALAAAATKEYPGQNVLVIDSGTCITYDFKDAQDRYQGGGISPGLQMRFKALNHFTAKLPLVAPGEKTELVGDSTENSIRSGVIFGALKEIEGVVAEYSGRYPDLRTIITGGDAHFLSVNLKNSIFANSNFLLEGLNYILEFNNSQ